MTSVSHAIVHEILSYTITKLLLILLSEINGDKMNIVQIHMFLSFLTKDLINIFVFSSYYLK